MSCYQFCIEGLKQYPCGDIVHWPEAGDHRFDAGGQYCLQESDMLIAALECSASAEASPQRGHAGLFQAEFSDDTLHRQPATGEHQPRLLWLLDIKPAVTAEVDYIFVVTMLQDGIGSSCLLVEWSDLSEVLGDGLRFK
jgi:hypothetical protein